MSRLTFLGSCLRCGSKREGRLPLSCCGVAMDVGGIAAPPPKGPGFGQGPRKELPKRHPARAAAAFARNFGPQSRLCRFLRCSVPGCLETGKIEPDHYQQRSRQGHDEHTWPLCWKHHRERHAGIETFLAKYRLDPVPIAAGLAARIAAHGTTPAEACSRFAELETESQADKRARRKHAIQRMRCGVCLQLLPEPAETTCP